MDSPIEPTVDLTVAADRATSVAGPWSNQGQFGKFQLIEELGRGGMGVVFKAAQSDLNRIVALKMVLSSAIAGSSELARFQTEAEAMASLNHPNIVRIYEVGSIDDQPFFTMEYIPGPNLANRPAGEPLRSKMAGRYIALAARGVQHAHEHQILHRDLKPANILLDENDMPRVTDFGLAKRMNLEGGQTRTDAIIGTPSYMAPEQAGGQKELTPAADVYGLGAVLYELLTARPPFLAETRFDTLVHVLERDPAPPRLLNPNIDRDLELICLKCLRKDPLARYPDAKSLAEDLERYLLGESITARPQKLASRVASMISHSQLDVQFQEYSTLLVTFALIMFCSEVAKFVAFRYTASLWMIGGIEVARFAGIAAALIIMRPMGLRATSAAERLMWSVWAGYIVTLFILATAHWIVAGGWFPAEELKLYPPLAAVTGMAFFALGSGYWGWCYVFGLLLDGLALVMLIDLSWAPLEFGAAWAAILIAVAIRLRRLANEEQIGPGTPMSHAPNRSDTPAPATIGRQDTTAGKGAL